ncbi:DNA-binding protein WhiA [Syntrophomonas palmitatica]|uniref:DNA-binding protein WhiA n=1 Tax=Syntrophomonas palmitatica TaxID=402877 RepID=UPI0006D2101B|nr:DNA-binding protein WhiA [Syntrophomonas palmitatica]
MSFSNEVRNELARLMPEKQCCRQAELQALLVSGAKWTEDDDELVLSILVENAATARKIFRLLKETYNLQALVRIEQRRFFGKNHAYEVGARLAPEQKQLREIITTYYLKQQAVPVIPGKACCKKAYLRGIFLSRGFINRPEGDYHLEIVCGDKHMAAEVQKLMARFDLHPRCFERKNTLVVYIKESEKIADFLRVVGASKALLDFENVRILKSMRNNVNRQVNCETANLSKTIVASVRQIELIEKFVEQKGAEALPRQLRELAGLRLEYPDSTLQELGELCTPPLSKSGVAYRMRKLEKIAEETLNSSD